MDVTGKSQIHCLVHVEKKEGSSPPEFVISEVQQRKKETVSVLNCKFDLEIICVVILYGDKGVVFRNKSIKRDRRWLR